MPQAVGAESARIRDLQWVKPSVLKILEDRGVSQQPQHPSTSSHASVKWFRQSSPYINAHRGKTFVVMLPGAAMEHDNFANIIHDLAAQ